MLNENSVKITYSNNTVNIFLNLPPKGERESLIRITTRDIEKYLRDKNISIIKCLKSSIVDNVNLENISGEWIFSLTPEVLEYENSNLDKFKDDFDKLAKLISEKPMLDSKNGFVEIDTSEKKEPKRKNK